MNYPLKRSRSMRGTVAALSAVTPEVRAQRAALLAERDRARDLQAANTAVEQARNALTAKENYAPERAALDDALARLAAIEGAQPGATGDRASATVKAAKR